MLLASVIIAINIYNKQLNNYYPHLLSNFAFFVYIITSAQH